ncbi:uncharacterized protein LOC133856708 [Alnus glutinosa]|uniref:uncharacterized protein LOC133856708 n=1 Tax=Alnus glutinosa TaxID=3517 RepID=UPI002D7A1B7D|nr:uncharacterized protein LOC133856708 [Alnus glutinosa]
MQRARRDFYWKGMKRDLKTFIRECPVCQQNKYETFSPASLLQSLPIPERILIDISLDFIEGLPKSHGYSVILVVVVRLSKYSHFSALTHPFTTAKVAQVFIANVFKLHGAFFSSFGQRPSTTKVHVVDELLRTREQIINLLEHNIKQAQQRLKKYADLRRSERTLEVLRRVGPVAYKLQLPSDSKIHPIFHVFQLKPKLGAQTVAIPTLPPLNSKGILHPEPMAVLDRRSRARNNRSFTEVLVCWEGQSAEDATWESFHALAQAYPHLVGKVL